MLNQFLLLSCVGFFILWIRYEFVCACACVKKEFRCGKQTHEKQYSPVRILALICFWDERAREKCINLENSIFSECERWKLAWQRIVNPRPHDFYLLLRRFSLCYNCHNYVSVIYNCFCFLASAYIFRYVTNGIMDVITEISDSHVCRCLKKYFANWSYKERTLRCCFDWILLRSK